MIVWCIYAVSFTSAISHTETKRELHKRCKAAAAETTKTRLRDAPYIEILLKKFALVEWPNSTMKFYVRLFIRL